MTELYLNNVLVDIDEEFSPTFQYKSFLLSKITEYEAPRTWEVSIPLTSPNLSVIEQAQAVDNQTNLPYTTLTVSMYAESYPIIEEGSAYLVRIDAKRAYFVFVKGKTIDVLKSLNEVKLNRLTERAETIFNWNRAASFNDLTDGFGLCNFYNYTNEDRTVTDDNVDIPAGVTHPTVKLSFILSYIESEFSLTLDGLSDLALFESVGIPLKGLKGLYDATVLQPIPITPYIVSETVDLLDASFTMPTADYIELEKNVDTYITFKFIPLIANNESYDLIFNLNLDSAYKLFIKKWGSPNYPEELIELPYTNIGGLYPYRYALTNYKVGVKPTRGVSISFESVVTYSEIWFDNAGTCDVLLSPANAFYGGSSTGFFPIIANLPELTCAEFINQCCMLTGLFPYVDPDTPTVVNFYSTEVLTDNTTVDWSDCLIKSTVNMADAEDMQFSLDGFSQRNLMLYAPDTTNQLDTSGVLTVANTNLPKESEFFRMYFAAGKRASENNSIIDYVLYDVSVDSGSLIRNAKTPAQDVLAYIANSGGVNYLTFPDSMKYSAIKANDAYTAYKSIINKPRTIKERFRFNASIVSGIDVRYPIYLRQYGKYYAILEAQVNGDYEADVTLLEIK